jgi:hypothetical protein
MPSSRRGYAGVRPSRTGCWGTTRRRTYSMRVSGVSPLAVSSMRSPALVINPLTNTIELWTTRRWTGW